MLKQKQWNFVWIVSLILAGILEFVDMQLGDATKNWNIWFIGIYDVITIAIIMTIALVLFVKFSFHKKIELGRFFGASLLISTISMLIFYFIYGFASAVLSVMFENAIILAFFIYGTIWVTITLAIGIHMTVGEE